MSVLQLSTGILDHSSFANCSRSLTFEGCLLPTAVLRSYVITVCLHARNAHSRPNRAARLTPQSHTRRAPHPAQQKRPDTNTPHYKRGVFLVLLKIFFFLTLKIKQNKYTKS